MYSFPQKHRVLVLGGDVRHILKARAEIILNNLKQHAKEHMDFSKVHIVVVEELYDLLKEITPKNKEPVLEDDKNNDKIYTKMVANG